MRIIMGQALAVGVLGGLAGIGFSWLSSRAIESVFPRFLLVLEEPAILRASALLLAASLLSPHMPLRDIYKLEPASVFNS